MRKEPALEEHLARWSITFLGGSVAILAMFLAVAYTLATQSAWVVLAVACLGVFVAQFYFLGSIGKYAPRQRLYIWQLSLLGHILLFGAVLSVVRDPTVALLVLLPEALSFAIHLVGLLGAFRAMQSP